jgi:hypothetical protein
MEETPILSGGSAAWTGRGTTTEARAESVTIMIFNKVPLRDLLDVGIITFMLLFLSGENGNRNIGTLSAVILPHGALTGRWDKCKEHHFILTLAGKNCP